MLTPGPENSRFNWSEPYEKLRSNPATAGAAFALRAFLNIGDSGSLTTDIPIAEYEARFKALASITCVAAFRAASEPELAGRMESAVLEYLRLRAPTLSNFDSINFYGIAADFQRQAPDRRAEIRAILDSIPSSGRRGIVKWKENLHDAVGEGDSDSALRILKHAPPAQALELLISLFRHSNVETRNAVVEEHLPYVRANLEAPEDITRLNVLEIALAGEKGKAAAIYNGIEQLTDPTHWAVAHAVLCRAFLDLNLERSVKFSMAEELLERFLDRLAAADEILEHQERELCSIVMLYILEAKDGAGVELIRKHQERLSLDFYSACRFNIECFARYGGEDRDWKDSKEELEMGLDRDFNSLTGVFCEVLGNSRTRHTPSLKPLAEEILTNVAGRRLDWSFDDQLLRIGTALIEGGEFELAQKFHSKMVPDTLYSLDFLGRLSSALRRAGEADRAKGYLVEAEETATRILEKDLPRHLRHVEATVTEFIERAKKYEALPSWEKFNPLPEIFPEPEDPPPPLEERVAEFRRRQEADYDPRRMQRWVWEKIGGYLIDGGRSQDGLKYLEKVYAITEAEDAYAHYSLARLAVPESRAGERAPSPIDYMESAIQHKPDPPGCPPTVRRRRLCPCLIRIGAYKRMIARRLSALMQRGFNRLRRPPARFRIIFRGLRF